TIPGCGEVPQCPVQVAERFLVGALGVLAPPSQGRVGLLPGVPQLVQVRGRVPLALGLVALLALSQAPVPSKPGSSGVRPQSPLLCWGGIQAEPVRLVHLHGAPPGNCFRSALGPARGGLPPVPVGPRVLRIWVISRATMSPASDRSTSSGLRQEAVNAASTYPALNRSRCFTTIAATDRSRRWRCRRAWSLGSIRRS